MCDNIATILETAIAQKLGTLPDLSAIDIALRRVLSL
jgi:hypothetical protein